MVSTVATVNWYVRIFFIIIILLLEARWYDSTQNNVRLAFCSVDWYLEKNPMGMDGEEEEIFFLIHCQLVFLSVPAG